MRRPLIIGLVAAVTLVAAGTALAHLTFDGTAAVAATFTASRDRVATRTCTGPDGVYELAGGRYEGEADSSTPALDGRIRLDVTTIYNTTERIGRIAGNVRINGSGRGDGDFRGRLVGTLTAGAGDTRVMDGFLSGRVGGHVADLFGNVTASFTTAGGFTGGKIGEGGANTALLVGRVCTGTPPIAVRLVVRGQIVALSDASITVAPRDGSQQQTCALRAGISPSTRRFETGDRVEMRCGLVEGAMTLLKLSHKGDDD